VSRDDDLRTALERAEAGDVRTAAAACRRALAADPTDAYANRLMGQIELGIGHPAEARRHLARAIDRSDAEQDYHDLARAFLLERRFKDSYRALDRGLRRYPGSEMLTGSRAEILATEGRHADALATIEPVLSSLGDRTPHPAVAVALSYVARRAGRVDEALGLLFRVADDESGDPRARTVCLFRAALLLDLDGRYEEAWATAERANARVSRAFDPGRFAGDVDRLIEDWPPERAESMLAPSTTSERPVFIVGMPRSGTSLTEQILSAHPAIYAGGETPIIPDLLGEITADASTGVRGFVFDQTRIDRLAGTLADRYHRLARRARRITDKLPDNVMQLGLIAMLLPGARVIHCVRDPQDTCLSCYFNLFRGHIQYAYDLTHLGTYARHSARLMDHWKRVLPLRFFDLRYEELVADQERVTRDLLDFLGLDWHDECLRFFESDRVALTASIDQVRRPIYGASVGRHKHYEPHLAPLERALAGA